MFRVVLVLALAGVVNSLDSRTILQYLGDNAQFSTLLGLLRDTHLDLVLQAPGAVYTMFAPTNSAFANLDPGLLDYIKGDPRLLQRVLMGHVLDSPFISLDMKNEHTERTLDGDIVRFNIYDNGKIYTVGGAAIIHGDDVLKNGVIHTINDVILPAEGDILQQILVDDLEFEDLTAAMAALTLFAPTNAGFLKRFPTADSIPSDMNQVKELLQNHVVNGTYYKAGLKDGDVLTTLAGNTLAITRTGTSQVRVNGHLIDGDIFATNGIIHVMNDILDPNGN
ncbi:hypothetical protein BaRGS_00004978 [Batillaria attramentaria]|uniref:FAS1 domain-containing protein n=1 Tax=Batillaria attramentaria TaxID=370345 RepID=A0ABD0LW37_9CAEN